MPASPLIRASSGLAVGVNPDGTISVEASLSHDKTSTLEQRATGLWAERTPRRSSVVWRDPFRDPAVTVETDDAALILPWAREQRVDSGMWSPQAPERITFLEEAQYDVAAGVIMDGVVTSGFLSPLTIVLPIVELELVNADGVPHRITRGEGGIGTNGYSLWCSTQIRAEPGQYIRAIARFRAPWRIVSGHMTAEAVAA